MLDFYQNNKPTSFSYLYHAIINSDINQFKSSLSQCHGEFKIGVYDANYTIPVIFRALMNYNQSQEANIIINTFIQYAKMNDLYDNKDYIFEGKTVKEYEEYIKNISV